ncbi:LysM peptidoglycan-binding domain-containing protein [Aestuariivita boseongensis]|uniref:LysM peptidoglycan-binding domain-containing protein n=1 Tax=Aestuariivita boseongensis TaxID=1470562 RepID=UPI000ABC0D62|nr:LysM peptidoglycan-binding domain-containing protein [Aestuariivita boseongensis]
MTEKAGFLGLGAAGGAAAGAAAVAAVIAVLYATGVLAPGDDPVAEPAAVIQPEPQPAPIADSTAPTEGSTAEPAMTPSEATETTAETSPAPEPAPTAAEDSATTEETTTAPAPSATASTPDTEPTSTEPASVPAAPAADAAPQTDEVATAPATPDTPVAPSPLPAPRFDVVRASPDGTTVIAGEAAPGSTVQILVDGEIADTQTASAQGEFVSLLTLPSSTQARVLSLLSRQDSREAPSAEEIILAPTPAPQVAAAEPAPQTAETETATDTAPQAEPASTTQPETADATVAPQTSAAEATAEGAEPQPAAVAVLRADEEGVELVQPATSEPASDASQIALDTIGYSPEGDVLLSGRAQGEGQVRVYLDNAARADVTTDASGRWRARLDGIAPGVYTLRLDELGVDGAVLSRLETPFKRESPETLASAQPQSDPPEEPAPITQVTVQAGDTLWAISRERYGDGLLYVRLFQANRDAIRDPDLIYPGQIFTIPE